MKPSSRTPKSEKKSSLPGGRRNGIQQAFESLINSSLKPAPARSGGGREAASQPARQQKEEEERQADRASCGQHSTSSAVVANDDELEESVYILDAK